MENQTTPTPSKDTTGAEGAAFTQPIPDKLDQNQALSILVQAAVFSQSKGIFALEDAEIISKAIRTFVIKKEDAPAETPAATDKA